MRTKSDRIVIIGGGLAGNLLAIVLARRGLRATVIEKSAPYRPDMMPQGRSINLALAARGVAALRRCGVFQRIEPLLISMRGRMIHQIGEHPRFASYGQRASEVNFSVSRGELNYALYRAAVEQFDVDYRFASTCAGIDSSTGLPRIGRDAAATPFEADVVFAADGAGSSIRRSLAKLGAVTVDESMLDHGYKELSISPTADGDFALDPHALHIWPRGNFMLIALPNRDCSFTATLFLPMRGDPSFSSIDASSVAEFFGSQFADVEPLLSNLEEDYINNPTGTLGTIRCRPWSFANRFLLIGDAAHAIVPFHGQGMNAAFEDVAAMDDLLDEAGNDWTRIIERFELKRIADSNAIADMALENYLEMRNSVLEPGFQLRRELAFELERRFPGRFVPRYSMVMFHPEISYSQAQQRGTLQQDILDKLADGVDDVRQIDFERAERLVREKLELLRSD